MLRAAAAAVKAEPRAWTAHRLGGMPSWVVARERSRLRWGGDLRRHYILSALGSTAGAVDVDGWSVAALRPVLPVPARDSDRPFVAAATLLPDPVLDLVRDRAIPGIVDVHDDPVAQTRALGMTPDPAWVESTLARRRRNAQRHVQDLQGSRRSRCVFLPVDEARRDPELEGACRQQLAIGDQDHASR